jgi:hypothetical protein
MVLMFILIFFAFALDGYTQKQHIFIIPLFYTSLLVASIYFCLHTTSHLNISF